MNEIRFIDLFSGIGGFRLGLEKTSLFLNSGTEQEGKTDPKNEPEGWDRHYSLERDAIHSEERTRTEWSTDRSSKRQSAFNCVWSCDFNKYANQVYTKQFGEENHYTADIGRVNPEEIPDFDLLCAGFPCQSFSSAGKRKGFQDTRGTLFFEICRVAEVKRPPLLLLENVKGLLNHDRGRTFTIVLQTLDELGYWLEWQVLNSKHFGVPQNRERVFIIGHLRGGSTRPIFPVLSNGETNTEADEKQDGQVTNTVTGGNASGFNARGNYVLAPEIAGTLTGGGHSGGLHSDMTLIIEDMKLRRLTPVECERLQGFPDGWTEGVSNSQRFRLLGNAVTVNVIEFLGELIKSQFTNKEGS